MKLQHPIPALCLFAGISLSPSASQAVLLGPTPNSPTIDFSAGIIDYQTATGMVTISGVPSSLFSASPFIIGEILGTGTDNIKDVNITFQIDSSGTLVPGDATVPDLVLTGSIDTNADGVADYSGTLLTAEATQFGFQDGGPGASDTFDLRLNNIGGALAYLYSGQDLIVKVNSIDSTEFINQFSGSFTADWQGPATGTIGSTAPIASGDCHMLLDAECSVDNGPFKDKCRINVTRSPKHWERHEHSHSGNIFYKSTYGMHGDPVPAWAANYPSASVTFRYIVTNDGANPVSDILIEDSFDTPLPIYPTSLAVGDSFTVTRTIDLQEGIENDVNLLGTYGGNICGANDVVVIKNKLRDRRRHDDDDYRDKGNHN